MDNRVTAGRIAGESLRVLGRNLGRTALVWLAAAVLFTGTNLVDIVYGAPQSGHGFTPAQIVSLAIRVIAPLIVSTAAWRIMLGSDRPAWAPDAAFWRYVLASILLLVVTFVPVVVVSHALAPVIAAHMADKTQQTIARGVIAFVMILFGVLITVRLLLWPTALAIGDRAVTFMTAWRATRGAAWAIVGALFLLGIPWVAAHFAATMWAVSVSGQARLVVTIGDGLLTVLQVMFGVAVAAGSYVALLRSSKA